MTQANCGGLNRQARNPVRLPDGSGRLASAGRSARNDIIDPRRQVGTPRSFRDGEDAKR